MILRFLYITLAFSLLSSQAGLPMWQHYCRGELKGTAWLSPPDSCHDEAEDESASCHMAATLPACPMHAVMEAAADLEHHLEDDCCTDKLDLSKLAQLQHVVDLPDWELSIPLTAIPAEVQKNVLPPAGKEMVLAQMVRPPPLIKSGRELRIRLESYLC